VIRSLHFKSQLRILVREERIIDVGEVIGHGVLGGNPICGMQFVGNGQIAVVCGHSAVGHQVVS
jgi:hypothetical protein